MVIFIHVDMQSSNFLFFTVYIHLPQRIHILIDGYLDHFQDS